MAVTSDDKVHTCSHLLCPQPFHRIPACSLPYLNCEDKGGPRQPYLKEAWCSHRVIRGHGAHHRIGGCGTLQYKTPEDVRATAGDFLNRSPLILADSLGTAITWSSWDVNQDQRKG